MGMSAIIGRGRTVDTMAEHTPVPRVALEHTRGDRTPLDSVLTEHAHAAQVPTLADLLETMRVVSIPMNTQFRGVTVREAALFEAPNGWVEFSPFLEYEPLEASTWLASALDAGWLPQPQPLRHSIPVNATLPAVGPAEVPRVMERYGDLTNLHTVKVKVAGKNTTLEADIARLQALRSFAGDEVRIRIDVNGLWSLPDALDALAILEPFDLEYVEQPVRTVEELAELREQLAVRKIAIPIAADESIRKSDDPLRVAALGAADLIIVKAQPLGGAHRILSIVESTGLPTVVSSALDTAVGIAFGARVAAALPHLDHACGLGTGALFAGDVVGETSDDSVQALPGHVRDFRTVPGWPVPSPKKLARFEAAADRRAWWASRVTSCFDLLSRKPPQ